MRGVRQRVDDEHGDVVAVVLLLLRLLAQRRGGGGGREPPRALRRLFHRHGVPQPVGREGYSKPGLLVGHDDARNLRLGDDPAAFPVAVAHGSAHGESPRPDTQGPDGFAVLERGRAHLPAARHDALALRGAGVQPVLGGEPRGGRGEPARDAQVDGGERIPNRGGGHAPAVHDHHRRGRAAVDVLREELSVTRREGVAQSRGEPSLEDVVGVVVYAHGPRRVERVQKMIQHRRRAVLRARLAAVAVEQPERGEAHHGVAVGDVLGSAIPRAPPAVHPARHPRRVGRFEGRVLSLLHLSAPRRAQRGVPERVHRARQRHVHVASLGHGAIEQPETANPADRRRRARSPLALG